MSCRVCGRGGCTESFHSFAEQEAADHRRAVERGDESDADKRRYADWGDGELPNGCADP